MTNLIKNSAFVTTKEPFFIFGLIFWGFGIWWVMMAIMMTLHYVKRLKLPYTMSWWASTFPLGTYVAASHSVAKIFSIELIDYIGFSLYFVLLFFWIFTLAKTEVNTYHGTLFSER